MTASILIVDDDLLLRDVTTKVLTKLGYRTIQAGSGAEAYALWQIHRDEVSLLLTDIHMPNETGDRLARRLMREKPGLKVLFMSGNLPDCGETCVPLVPGENLLPKPFSIADLSEAIAQRFAPSC